MVYWWGPHTHQRRGKKERVGLSEESKESVTSFSCKHLIGLIPWGHLRASDLDPSMIDFFAYGLRWCFRYDDMLFDYIGIDRWYWLVSLECARL